MYEKERGVLTGDERKAYLSGFISAIALCLMLAFSTGITVVFITHAMGMECVEKSRSALTID